MRQIRVHGQDRPYHHPRVGINGRMDAIQAAVLLAKLDIFDQEVERRVRIGEVYSQLIEEAFRSVRADNGVTTPYIESHNLSVYAQYTIEVPARDKVQAFMKSRGIPTAIHYPVPLHLQPAFSNLGLGRGSFPVSKAAAERVISLPMHPYLTEEQQFEVLGALREAVVG